MSIQLFPVLVPKTLEISAGAFKGSVGFTIENHHLHPIRKELREKIGVIYTTYNQCRLLQHLGLSKKVYFRIS